MEVERIYSLMMGDPSQSDAELLFGDGWWNQVGLARAAFLQLHQQKLCMPFQKFHEAIEFMLGRPVWTHEFAHPDLLKAEAVSGNSPTLQEIMDLIPAEKRIVISLESQE